MRKYMILPVVSLLLLVIFCGCGKEQSFNNQIHDGEIQSQAGVFIDTKLMQLTFGEDASIVYDGGSIAVGGTVHDLTVFFNGDEIYYDPQTDRLTSVAYGGNILLGTFRQPVYMCELDMEQELLFVNQLSIPQWKSLQQKKVVCLGDSMTEGTGTTKVYTQWIQEEYGLSEVKGFGVAGSCIAPKVDEIPTWEKGILSFCERYAAMDDDADIVIVLGGVNDWCTGRELGAATDNNADTFYGAMRTLCSGLKEKYPDAEIFFFSSPQNDYVARPANDLSGTQWADNTEGYNRKGYKLDDYDEAMETVCQQMNVHFYSLVKALPWGEGKFSADNGANDTDGPHPNADGHAVLAEEMMTYILQEVK